MAKQRTVSEPTLDFLTIAQVLSDEDNARKTLEIIRWPDGVAVCPHCGEKGAYKLTTKSTSKTRGRKGAWKCKACRRVFTVTVGSIFEGSHIKLGKWLMAYCLFCASKKSISAKQISRQLKIGYHAAWFMLHRIRFSFAMEPKEKLSGVVEVDETYVGGKPRKSDGKVHKRGRGTSKIPVLALVERNGRVRTRVIADITADTLKSAIREQVDGNSRIVTDELPSYRGIGRDFDGGHDTVNHGQGEYARGDVNTNTAESFFSLLKRAVYGTWHHVSKTHLHRYTTEFDFRWNSREQSDEERVGAALKQVGGKRLLYKTAISE